MTHNGAMATPGTDLDPLLLELVACPACHGGLAVDPQADELTCTGCGRAYPIIDGIPVLLVDEARAPGA